jgi:hypothetical protein
LDAIAFRLISYWLRLSVWAWNGMTETGFRQGKQTMQKNREYSVCKLALITMTISAVGCDAEDDGDRDLSQLDGVIELEDEGLAVEDEVDEVGSELIASLEPRNGTVVDFFDVAEGDDVSVFVVETVSEGGVAVLDRVLDVGAGDINALDVYLALSGEDEDVPAILFDNFEAQLEGERGWAVAEFGLASPPDVQLADEACSNGSFTGSHPNGFLGAAGYAFTRLDTNNSVHPSLWATECYNPGDGSSHCIFQTYAAQWFGIEQWRGKACGNAWGNAAHTICPNIGPCLVINPRMHFEFDDDNGTNWSIADTEVVTVNGGDISNTWAWFGSNNEDWAWRVHIHQANGTNDFFDVAMDHP